MQSLSTMSLTRTDSESGFALCQSCDRCRSRKTKCDGQRPCANCSSKYMKKNKLTSLDGIDLNEIECIYSPAKRRGPVPGRSSRKSLNSLNSSSRNLMDHQAQFAASEMQNAEWGTFQHGQQQNNPFLAMTMNSSTLGTSNMSPMNNGMVESIGGIDQSNGNINLHSQSMMQQHTIPPEQAPTPGLQRPYSSENMQSDQPPARRAKMETNSHAQPGSSPKLPNTIVKHSHLLDRSDSEGARLFSFYKLSVDELFRLPPTPTDEEYLSLVNSSGLMNASSISGSQLVALSAARFAEIALGAVVHNEISLAMELCNAVVHCLRESVQESSGPILFEIAKAYFLLGVFRAYRGDMDRYFRYRKVCMSYLGKLENSSGTAQLTAAISFLDSWAYMVYNADEKQVPKANNNTEQNGISCYSSGLNGEYSMKCDPSSIACNPVNRNWIQGAPPVYLNNEAPLQARALDAIACAVRTCCDQANGRFAELSKEADDLGGLIPEETILTPTTTAVMANENELCSRNLILSAYTLMQQFEQGNHGKHRHEGQHVLISAMDAFLENSDEEGAGFTDNQVQSLLSVCNTVIENPFLLHHAGPTYHMITNACVLLGHIMNGMHAMKANNAFGQAEATMMEEILDTFIATRKLLTIHRRKLPLRLRCHGIPRPTLGAEIGQQVVDLGETILCACRGCQGFVLMACSPCVAAERARNASRRTFSLDLDDTVSAAFDTVGLDELDRDLAILGAEFDMDDDALLGMVSNLISN